MFGIGGTELLVILVVALVVLGPKSVPQIARTLGKAMGEFRRVSTEFQRTLNTEIELEEHEKRKKRLNGNSMATPLRSRKSAGRHARDRKRQERERGSAQNRTVRSQSIRNRRGSSRSRTARATGIHSSTVRSGEGQGMTDRSSATPEKNTRSPCSPPRSPPARTPNPAILPAFGLTKTRRRMPNLKPQLAGRKRRMPRSTKREKRKSTTGYTPCAIWSGRRSLPLRNRQSSSPRNRRAQKRPFRNKSRQIRVHPIRPCQIRH